MLTSKIEGVVVWDLSSCLIMKSVVTTPRVIRTRNSGPLRQSLQLLARRRPLRSVQQETRADWYEGVFTEVWTSIATHSDDEGLAKFSDLSTAHPTYPNVLEKSVEVLMLTEAQQSETLNSLFNARRPVSTFHSCLATFRSFNKLPEDETVLILPGSILFES